METILTLAAVGLAIGTAAGLRHRALRRQDAERRHGERAMYEQRREAERAERSEAVVADLVARYFPFVRESWVASRGRGTGSERLRRALGEVEGVVVGAADVGFPAVLAQGERRKHLLIVGRSGGGKTTILLRILAYDLSRGSAVFVLGSESEFFRDWALGLVPASRVNDVVYFRPADPRCGLVWNPLVIPSGIDRAVAAGQVFTAIKRALGETEIGARADAILANALAAIIGRPDASLWSLVRFLEDETYRGAVVATIDDPVVQAFWTRTALEFPTGAALPIVTRMSRFLRVPAIRAALCGPVSTVSLHDALANARIVYFDLGGLDEETAKLIGFLALAALQIELFRRDSMREEERAFVAVCIDEMHFFSASAEGFWRELLARGRRHGLGLTLATQHLSALPRSLQQEVRSNCSSLIAVGLSAADAVGFRRELVVPTESGELAPVPSENLVASKVGEGFARLGTGSCALRVRFAPPVEKPDPRPAERVRDISWRTYAAPPLPKEESVRAAMVTATSPMTPPVEPGRGSAPHKMIQKLAKEWGEARGFRATLEAGVLGGTGRVDVVLERQDLRIAVEVAVANSPAEVADAVVKDVAAGFDHVVVVSPDADLLRRSEASAAEALPKKAREKVRFVFTDGLSAFLDGLGGAGTERPAGYRVRIEGQTDPARRRGLARLVGASLLRRRRTP